MAAWKLQEFALHPLIWEIQNKASSHSVSGMKVTTFCPPVSPCHSCLCLNYLYCRDYFGYKSSTAIKSCIKDKYNPAVTSGLFIYYTQTAMESQTLFWWHTSYSLKSLCRQSDGGLHFTPVRTFGLISQCEFLNIDASVDLRCTSPLHWVKTYTSMQYNHSKSCVSKYYEKKHRHSTKIIQYILVFTLFILKQNSHTRCKIKIHLHVASSAFFICFPTSQTHRGGALDTDSTSLSVNDLILFSSPSVRSVCLPNHAYWLLINSN